MADTGRQRKGDAALLLALARGQTVRDGAIAAGISERTAYRRAADQEFRRRVSSARADMFQQAVGTLAATAVEAAGTLRKLLDAQSEAVRLSAARAILENGWKLCELVDVADRVTKLEENYARLAEPSEAAGENRARGAA